MPTYSFIFFVIDNQLIWLFSLIRFGYFWVNKITLNLLLVIVNFNSKVRRSILWFGVSKFSKFHPNKITLKQGWKRVYKRSYNHRKVKIIGLLKNYRKFLQVTWADFTKCQYKKAVFLWFFIVLKRALSRVYADVVKSCYESWFLMKKLYN